MRAMIHGTDYYYNQGCRCSDCRAANARRAARDRAKRKKPTLGLFRAEGHINVHGFTPLEEAIIIELGHCEESPLFGASLPPRPFTNAEIGEIFGVTHQAVSIQCANVLEKLGRSKLRNWKEEAA